MMWEENEALGYLSLWLLVSVRRIPRFLMPRASAVWEGKVCVQPQSFLYPLPLRLIPVGRLAFRAYFRFNRPVRYPLMAAT